MRLDKCLSEMGAGSRAFVKELIRKGRVSVNGSVCKEPERAVNESDVFTVDGEPLKYSAFEYYMLYKPAGYLTARADDNRPVVMELLPLKRKDLSPVGRLDADTEGLLLITNDGALNHKLTAPKSGIPKKYFARFDGIFPEDAEEILSKPVAFQDFVSSPAELQRISENEAFLTVTEGKFHEVKRLFHHIGCEVTYLKRVEFAGLTLGDLEKGAFRALSEDEVNYLKNL